jgi:hypothetical protein
MNAGPKKAACALLILAAMVVSAGEACAQAAAVAQPKPSKTMASLMAEGYEIQDIRIFPDKIWMRKSGGEGGTFICDRGRIGSAAFDAYRNRKYEEISCSPAQ